MLKSLLFYNFDSILIKKIGKAKAQILTKRLGFCKPSIILLNKKRGKHDTHKKTCFAWLQIICKAD